MNDLHRGIVLFLQFFIFMVLANCASYRIAKESDVVDNASIDCVSIKTDKRVYDSVNDVRLISERPLTDIYLIIAENTPGMMIEQMSDGSSHDPEVNIQVVPIIRDFLYWNVEGDSILSLAWDHVGIKQDIATYKVQSGWYRLCLWYTDRKVNQGDKNVKCCKVITNAFYISKDFLLVGSSVNSAGKEYTTAGVIPGGHL